MNINFNEIEDIIVANIDMRDYPDFCDAYIESATIEGREATDEELDYINDNSEFVYNAVIDYIH